MDPSAPKYRSMPRGQGRPLPPTFAMSKSTPDRPRQSAPLHGHTGCRTGHSSRYVEGQIQGGVAQGIGWALYEEYIYDKQGRLDNPGFLDYRVPVASDLPMIEAVIVEVSNPRHLFGVRGVGVLPIVPSMAAVANAIHAATGMRLRDLPMWPPKVLAEIDAEEPRRLAAE